MIGVSSAQKNTNDSPDGTSWSAVSSIPLSEEGTGSGGEQSIGNLVRDATAHVSTLVRAEVELAKTEITSEIKKGVKGSVYFVLALAVLGFSMFFLFFTAAEFLYFLGLWRWASFGIVFLVMLLVAGVFGLLGYRRVRKIRAPQRTIDSLKDTAQVARKHGGEQDGEAAKQGTGERE